MNLLFGSFFWYYQKKLLVVSYRPFIFAPTNDKNYKDYENTNNYMYILYNKLASTYVENAYQNSIQDIL